MGVKKTSDFLEKSTWTLALALVGLTLLSHAFKSDTKEDQPRTGKEVENTANDLITNDSENPEITE